MMGLEDDPASFLGPRSLFNDSPDGRLQGFNMTLQKQNSPMNEKEEIPVVSSGFSNPCQALNVDESKSCFETQHLDHQTWGKV